MLRGFCGAEPPTTCAIPKGSLQRLAGVGPDAFATKGPFIAANRTCWSPRDLIGEILASHSPRHNCYRRHRHRRSRLCHWGRTVQIGSTAINYVRYWSAPAGTLETEFAPTGAATQPPTSTASAAAQAAPGGTEGDWPSYNKTLSSNRFSQLNQINRTNAAKLKVLCTYDTRQYTSSIPGCWR